MELNGRVGAPYFLVGLRSVGVQLYGDERPS